MATRVADMTTDELGAMIEALIDRKLAEWLGDADEGLELREDLRERILRQRAHDEAGGRGKSLEELIERFESD